MDKEFKLNRRLIIAYHNLPLSLQSVNIRDKVLSSIVSSITSLRENNGIEQIVWVGCPNFEDSNNEDSNIQQEDNQYNHNYDEPQQQQQNIDDNQINNNNDNNIEILESNYKDNENLFCTVESISNKLYDDSCNKFTYQYLRPIFHYNISNVQFNESRWNSYREFNRCFAKRIQEIYEEGDIIWVHGPQLLLLPKLLRKEMRINSSGNIFSNSECTIGLFIHIPFPAVEVFRCLSTRKKILKGMLGANLVAFQTYCYSRYFNQSCTRIIGAHVSFDGVKFRNEKQKHIQFTKVSVYAQGINPNDAISALNTNESRETVQRLKETFKGKKIIISKDHGDAIEATTRKLLAFELFLQKHPDWITKIVFILICDSFSKYPINSSGGGTYINSSTSDSVKNNNKLINETVARINGEYGKIGMNPIEYITRHIDYSEMCTMFNVADIFISTPLRDGMNLEVHDFVACHSSQEREECTLILSEFDGTCRCFSGAFQVNPFSTQQISKTIFEALNRDKEEILRRHRDNLYYIRSNTSLEWVQSFLFDLDSQTSHATTECQDDSHLLRIKDLDNSLRSTKKRLFIFDYDGAFKNITPMSPQPYLPVRIARILRSLTSDPNNITYVISSRDTETMETLLENIPQVGLSTECGNFLKSSNGISLSTSPSSFGSHSSTPPNINNNNNNNNSMNESQSEWQNLSAGLDLSWREMVVQILEYFTERLPLSNLEVNRVTITWSYENCLSDYAMELAQELLTTLMEIAGKTPIGISHANKTIEIKPAGIGKSCAMKKIIDEIQDLDFIFCIGDDRTEVELFQLLDRDNQNHFPVSVGTKKSYSKYFVPNQKKVLELLESILMITNNLNSTPHTITSSNASVGSLDSGISSLGSGIDKNIIQNIQKNYSSGRKSSTPNISSFSSPSYLSSFGSSSSPNISSLHSSGISISNSGSIPPPFFIDDKLRSNGTIQDAGIFPLPSIPFYNLDNEQQNN